VELVTNATNAVRGYDPLTGKELWRLAGNTLPFQPGSLFLSSKRFIPHSYGIIPVGIEVECQPFHMTIIVA
jgi:hypothetical protein